MCAVLDPGPHGASPEPTGVQQDGQSHIHCILSKLVSNRSPILTVETLTVCNDFLLCGLKHGFKVMAWLKISVSSCK